MKVSPVITVMDSTRVMDRSGLLNVSLCLPHAMGSEYGVCRPVFLPSIHTSDQGLVATAIEHPPGGVAG